MTSILKMYYIILKQEATIHLRKWPKPRTWTTSNAAKDGKRQSFHVHWLWECKWYSHFERQVSSVLQSRAFFLQAIILKYLPRLKCPHKTWKGTLTAALFITTKAGGNQDVFQWVNKQPTIVLSDPGISVSVRKKGAVKSSKTQSNPENLPLDAFQIHLTSELGFLSLTVQVCHLTFWHYLPGASTTTSGSKTVLQRTTHKLDTAGEKTSNPEDIAQKLSKKHGEKGFKNLINIHELWIILSILIVLEVQKEERNAGGM